MLFWLIAGALALAVVLLMALALVRVRAEGTAPPARAQDMQVYRDQLAEVDRDLARGVLNQAEAERVRIEVSRRLLEADKAAHSVAAAGQAPRGLTLLGTAAMALVVVGLSIGVYLQLGAPGYPDLPLQLRIDRAETVRAERPGQAEAEDGFRFTPPPEADQDFLDLMEKLRAATTEKPDELQGQQLLARNEAMLGNFIAAHPAQARVIALKGEAATAHDHASHADLLIQAAGGYVSPEAEAALKHALALDARNGTARYYTGLMHAQVGRPDLAFAVWQPLLAESRPEAPWVPPILGQIEQAAAVAGIQYTAPQMAPVATGPSAEDMQAASELSDEDQTAMIRGMVDGLAERLATEGGTPEEWARLINALAVLGETDRASAIWTEAQEVFADTPGPLALIRNAAKTAGVAE